MHFCARGCDLTFVAVRSLLSMKYLATGRKWELSPLLKLAEIVYKKLLVLELVLLGRYPMPESKIIYIDAFGFSSKKIYYARREKVYWGSPR